MVTGGTGALGKAVVAGLVARGAVCHVSWLFETELEDFPRHDRVALHRVDCSDESQVEAFFAGQGQLSASLHIVGGFAMQGVTDTSLADFSRQLNLNAATCFLCCREAVRTMRAHGGGRIVNVASRVALEPTPGMLAYSTAKGAVASITRALAAEVLTDRILVNAVAPSIMDTPANRAAMPDADFGSWPSVEAVARAILFLASPANAVSSGTVLPVYGHA